MTLCVALFGFMSSSTVVGSGVYLCDMVLKQTRDAVLALFDDEKNPDSSDPLNNYSHQNPNMPSRWFFFFPKNEKLNRKMATSEKEKENVEVLRSFGSARKDT
jgi:hypothetical protein